MEKKTLAGRKKMKEKTPEGNLDALNAGIAKSREEIDALAAVLKKLPEWKITRPSVLGEHPLEGPTNGDKRHGGWTGFRRRLDDAGSRGGKIVKGLAEEIERHPLLGGMAAFGLGFAIATLLYRRSKRDSGQ